MSRSQKKNAAVPAASSRRDVLRALGLAGSAVLLAPFSTRVAMAQASGPRAMDAGSVALELEGVQIPLGAFEGGSAVAEVAPQTAPDAGVHTPERSPGQVDGNAQRCESLHAMRFA